MELSPNGEQHLLLLLELAGLMCGDEPRLCEFTPATAEAVGRGDPGDHLQVAKSTGALLDIGLKGIGGVLESDVPLTHLQQLALREPMPIHTAPPLGLEPLEHLGAPAEQP